VTEVAAKPAVPAIEILEVPTAVYRFYDRANVLLYVGISSNLATRWAKHAAEKDWWPQVARKTVVMYGSRDEAAAEEDRAILEESPIHNIVGRTAKPVRVAPRPSVYRPPVVGRGSDTFRLGREYLSMVDEYAEDRGISRDEAVPKLLFNSLMNAKLEEFADDRETLALMEAKAMSLGIDFPRWARVAS